MTLSVVELRPMAPCADVVATLRRIADDIESGSHDAADWPATTAVLILAHLSERPDGPDMTVGRYRWTTHGFGPKADAFTVKGVLASVLGGGFNSGDGE